MADNERTILDFYQLSTPFPSEWPSEKNEAEGSEEEEELKPDKAKVQRRKSRYHALEKAAGDRRSSYVPGSEAGKGGKGNLVQKDESDALGSMDSVVMVLKSMGLPVQDDLRLRRLLGGSDADTQLQRLT